MSSNDRRKWGSFSIISCLADTDVFIIIPCRRPRGPGGLQKACVPARQESLKNIMSTIGMPFIVQNTIKPWALFLSQRPINYENYTCPRPWTYCFIKVPMNKLQALKNIFLVFIWHTPPAWSCLPRFIWLAQKRTLESWAHFKSQVLQAGWAVQALCHPQFQTIFFFVG